MRRVLIALGLLAVLIGLLTCWPYLRLILTHQHAQGQIIEVFRDPQPNGSIRLSVAYLFHSAPDREFLAWNQADQFFRLREDPLLSIDEAQAVLLRLTPDGNRRTREVRVWFRANDPAGSAFIIDVSTAHALRRYATGLAAAAAGLLLAWWAWRSGRWEPAR